MTKYLFSESNYREFQLDFTPEMEVLYVLFERCQAKTRKRSIKQHIKYFHFRIKIKLDHPVHFELAENIIY